MTNPDLDTKKPRLYYNRDEANSRYHPNWFKNEPPFSMANTIYPCNGGIPAHPTLSGCSSWVSSMPKIYRIAPTFGSLKTSKHLLFPVITFDYIVTYSNQ